MPYTGIERRKRDRSKRLSRAEHKTLDTLEQIEKSILESPVIAEIISAFTLLGEGKFPKPLKIPKKIKPAEPIKFGDWKIEEEPPPRPRYRRRRGMHGLEMYTVKVDRY